jgi:hypothetical protein
MDIFTLLKEKALDDPKRHPLVYVAEPGSLEAQRECLELFVSYLPNRYPDMYTYDSESESITVKPLNKTFGLKDWINIDRPTVTSLCFHNRSVGFRLRPSASNIPGSCEDFSNLYKYQLKPSS